METNIEKLKETAKLLLELPIEEDSNFGFIVHHPIFRDRFIPKQVERNKNNPAGIVMLDVSNQEDLKEVKKIYEEMINKSTHAFDFFMILNKPYSGFFFKLVKDYLGEKDYANMLEHLWTSMEYPNADKNVTKKEWIEYWTHANLDYIYSDEDKEILNSLPEEFYVYRGLMKNAKVKALSWTLDIDRAIWFAKRFDRHGKVYKAKCNKKDILAYLSGRNEEEIVVDYKKLKNIEEVEYAS